MSFPGVASAALIFLKIPDSIGLNRTKMDSNRT